MSIRCHIIFCIIIALSSTDISANWCCPGCVPTASETRAETVARSDVVLLVQWVSSTARDGENAANTVYQVTLVGKDSTELYQPKQLVALDNYREAEPGDLFFLNGLKNSEETIDWEAPVEISETGYHYVMQAPSPELPRHERLPYFVKFLEFPDDFIADDAYNEFAFAPFEDVVTLADKLPIEKLRTWLNNKETPQSRIGLYGILLGLCGQPSDADLLGEKFFEKADQYVFGMEGIVTGYLFLTRDEGLLKIREKILATQEKSVDFLYPLMRAFRIVWTYGGDRVPKSALISAMRTFLEHERLDELVIPDLARWKDWQPIDLLIEKYETHPEKKHESLKRAIIIYMMECANQETDETGTPSPTADKAQAFLDKVEQEDPILMKKVRRIYRVEPRKTPESEESPAE
ncbi:MAG: hypothetical protein P8M30_20720 [Planctomycetaceae bacterium]|nr:hypothetical protein [Planctomycetaceae bacterium]